MANSKGTQNIRSLMFSGKNALLPPKCPFPTGSALYPDYVPSNSAGSKAVQKPREVNTHHHRTSSESFLIEEQPSWLDDLLNEPETPVRKGHRRSSSDSFAYGDMANGYNMDPIPDMYGHRQVISGPPRSSYDFEYHKNTRHQSFFSETNLMKLKNKGSEPLSQFGDNLHGVPSASENFAVQNLGPSSRPQETAGISCLAGDNEDTSHQVSSFPTKVSSENIDDFYAKHAASDNETKHARQHFAQRSRVRKLQYIAELEKNVQALQAEGSEVSAELEFLNQQNLILNMENKALKHRLENLAQEQLIKYMEHEVLEKEIARLRALYQQQQQQPHEQQIQSKKPSSSSHRRSKSRDLDSQFSNLSLKP